MEVLGKYFKKILKILVERPMKPKVWGFLGVLGTLGSFGPGPGLGIFFENIEKMEILVNKNDFLGQKIEIFF